MADPITVYHPGIPGDENKTVERSAYRQVWYDKGWRSFDDPTWFGSGSEILHATDIPSGWGEQWQAARGDTSRPRIAHWWGDSLSVGDDASSDNAAGAAANTFAQKDAWRNDGMVGVFASRMQAKLGDGGSGFSPFGLAVTTGTWTAGIGFGACEFRAAAAASAEWHVRGTNVRIYHRNANMLAGSFRYQVDGGAFTTVTPPTGFGVDPGVVEITGLTAAEHTVRVEWVSGTIGINGVEAWMATGSGFRCQRIAQHGLAANDLANPQITRRIATCGITSGSTALTSPTAAFSAADVGAIVTGPGTSAVGSNRIESVTNATTAVLASNATATNAAAKLMIGQVNFPAQSASGSAIDRVSAVMQTIQPGFSSGLRMPDIVILALNVNDPSNLQHTPSAIVELAALLARRYEALADDTGASAEGGNVARTPEFVVVISHLGKWFDVGSAWPRYAAACRDAAHAVDAAVIDMWNAGRRSYKFMQDRGYWSGAAHDNSVHLSKSGHSRVGNAVADLFL